MEMKNTLFYMFVLLFFSCSGSKEKFLHPDSVSPEIYEVLLDNDDVKNDGNITERCTIIIL